MEHHHIVLIGILLGTFVTMSLLNGVIYLFLREKTYLYYAIYQIAMFFFQLASMGVGDLFDPNIGLGMTFYQGFFSSMMLTTSLVFVKSFLNTRHNTPRHHKALNLLITGLILNMGFMFVGYRSEATVATDFWGVLTAILTVNIAILCVRLKVNQAKYFLSAWLILITGGLVFILRNMGIISNTTFVQYFMLASGLCESIIIFAALVDRTKVVIREKYEALENFHEAEKNRKKAELAYLKAQIKPHFLYNTLSVIDALTIKNPERAKKMIHHLSNYLRGSFHFENDNGMTLLSEELETVKAYLAIEKERFQDKLTIEYDIEELSQVTIPLLTIQPLVENALRHGIFMKPGGGHIKISIKRQPMGLFIRVADNGIGMSKEKREKILNQPNGNEGVGLWNINERLIRYYGERLVIESEDGNGTSVAFRIPMEEGV